MGKNILFISGHDIPSLTELIVKGTPASIIISKQALSEEELEKIKTDTPQFLEEKKEQAKERKFIQALNDKSIELIIVEKTSISDEDYALYKRLGKTFECNNQTITVTSENSMEIENHEKMIVFLNGENTDVLRTLITKGIPNSFMISPNGESIEARDRKFIEALNKEFELITVDTEKINSADNQLYKRLGKTFRCKGQTIAIVPETKPVQETTKQKTNFFGRKN